MLVTEGKIIGSEKVPASDVDICVVLVDDTTVDGILVVPVGDNKVEDENEVMLEDGMMVGSEKVPENLPVKYIHHRS